MAFLSSLLCTLAVIALLSRGGRERGRRACGREPSLRVKLALAERLSLGIPVR